MTIEGFDPAKFKAANKAGDTTSRTDLRSLNINTTQASTLRYKTYFTFYILNSSKCVLFPRTVPNLSEPPGFVPTYDHSEQQLLASLERELGV